MGDDERRTVQIGCRIANGIELRLFGPGHDDGTGTGFRPIVPGRRIALQGPNAVAAGGNDGALHERQIHILNDVDESFWDAWTKQNAGKNPIFDQGLVFEAGPDRKASSL